MVQLLRASRLPADFGGAADGSIRTDHSGSVRFSDDLDNESLRSDAPSAHSRIVVETLRLEPGGAGGEQFTWDPITLEQVRPWLQPGPCPCLAPALPLPCPCFTPALPLL